MSRATAIPSLSSGRALSLVAGGVLTETIRRKEFYVLLLLTALYALGMIVVNLVGVENPATATFLLNLGMTFACGAAHILVLLTASRQIANEMETRSLYPLLAKPLPRSHYLLGKWLATTLSGAFALVVLTALAWIPVPKLQDYNAALLIQTVLLQGVSLAMMAAIALSLSLVFPKGVNLVLMALLYAVGDKVVGFVRTWAAGGGTEKALDWVCYYIPNFTPLNVITRYTDGVGPLAPGEFLGLVLYGAIFTSLPLVLAIAAFNRRPL